MILWFVYEEQFFCNIHVGRLFPYGSIHIDREVSRL